MLTSVMFNINGECLSVSSGNAGDIDRLSQAVLNSAQLANKLLATFEATSLDADSTEEQPRSDSVALQQALSNAGSRLQFVDRLQQRLSNVAKNLTALAKIMESAKLPITDTRWREFLEKTRASFTMVQERQMFDAAFEVCASSAIDGQDSAPSHEPVLFDEEVTG